MRLAAAGGRHCRGPALSEGRHCLGAGITASGWAGHFPPPGAHLRYSVCLFAGSYGPSADNAFGDPEEQIMAAQTFGYIDGFLIPVRNADRETYRAHEAR